METKNIIKLISFLQSELGIPAAEIIRVQVEDEDPNLLPIVLWQYGLLTLEQVERVFDWLSKV